MRTGELFDVVIYNIETKVVDTIAGEAMRRDTGHYNAERLLDTVTPRLNGHYNAEIVPTGKYKVGDVLE